MVAASILSGLSPSVRCSLRTQPIRLILCSLPPKFASTNLNNFSASAKGDGPV